MVGSWQWRPQALPWQQGVTAWQLWPGGQGPTAFLVLALL